MNCNSPQEFGSQDENREALERVMFERGRDLLAIAYSHCKSSELANDVVQEACARFLASNAIINDPFNWLAVVARNYARDCRRRKAISACVMDNDTIDTLSSHQAEDQSADAGREQERAEDAHILKGLIQELSPEERGIFLMRASLEWPSKRIGDVLDISAPNIDMRLSRIRKKLRTAYQSKTDDRASSSSLYTPA